MTPISSGSATPGRLTDCALAGWSPLSDGQAAGLVLEAALYAGVAVLALVAAGRSAGGAGGGAAGEATGRAGRQPQFWYLVALMLVAFGLIGVLDIPVLATDAMRCLARYQGWYWEGRRSVQTAAGLAGLAGVAAVALAARPAPAHALALAGLALLGGVLVLTAVGHHAVDAALGRGAGALTVGRALHVAGLAAVAANALRVARPRRRAVGKS